MEENIVEGEGVEGKGKVEGEGEKVCGKKGERVDGSGGKEGGRGTGRTRGDICNVLEITELKPWKFLYY